MKLGRQSYFILLILGVIFTLSSCKKDFSFATGDEQLENRAIETFQHIQLWDNVDLQISQDTSNKVQVMAGEHLLDGIYTEVNNGILSIGNRNKFNWLRSYKKKPLVFIRVKNLNELEIHGTGEIISSNTLKNDSMMLNVWDAAGKVNLDLQCYKSTIRYHIGTADIIYRGSARLSYISSNSFGPVDASEFKSEQTYISTLGSNTNYVWATEILEATVSSIGSIYYVDEPKILRKTITGTGEIEKFQP
ncbi:MAG: DUF2807 domain-containing protein [Bacteroidales bacterium]|nr:DUF2807 domain-containing protein [Bacteroidales bacterium]